MTPKRRESWIGFVEAFMMGGDEGEPPIVPVRTEEAVRRRPRVDSKTRTITMGTPTGVQTIPLKERESRSPIEWDNSFDIEQPERGEPRMVTRGAADGTVETVQALRKNWGPRSVDSPSG